MQRPSHENTESVAEARGSSDRAFEQRLRARLGRLGALTRHHWAFVMALAVGAILRVAMWVALPHPLMTFTDANVYVRAAQQFLFRPLEGRTAGYPLFLRELHGIDDSVDLPVISQHALVLLACVALYLVALAVRVRPTAAAIPVLVWAVSVDWLWLEHQLLSETLGVALVVFALAAVVVPRTPRILVAVLISVLGGALIMAAGFARPALFASVPGIGLAVLLLLDAPFRVRVVSFVCLVATCGGLFWGYETVQENKTGFRGLVRSELDMGAYPGVAPHARCTEFVAPRGTRSLCETTRPRDRPGGDYYYWDPSSPGRRLLAARPDLAPAIRLWAARAALVHVEDARKEQLNAFQRLFGLGGFIRPATDSGPGQMRLDIADESPAPVVIEAVGEFYGAGATVLPHSRSPYGVLVELQPITRPPGPLLLVAGLLALAGALVGAGRARRGAVVFGVVGWLPVVFATYTGGQYYWRYVLIGVPLIALAAVAGGVALHARARAGGALRRGDV